MGTSTGGSIELLIYAVETRFHDRADRVTYCVSFSLSPLFGLSRSALQKGRKCMYSIGRESASDDPSTRN